MVPRLGQLSGLTSPFLVERDVLGALKPPLTVPIGFTMTNENNWWSWAPIYPFPGPGVEG